MQQRIQQLDPAVVGLIAAGEVVERPALAIKELIENSIDAQATSVSVEIKDGGLGSFRVTDNGFGIPREELRLAFSRHATSKLRTAEELEAIETLGFRGEALASIAAVARVSLTSRQRGRDEGAVIEIEGGQILDIREAASPEGTSILVRDLFFNTPARLKFMKKPATEAGQVSDMMAHMMMARPDIAMRLTSNGKQVYRSPGDGKLLSVLGMLWGRETAERLVPVRGHAAGCFWEGYLGVGELSRSGRSHQAFMLNGRYVRSALLAQAVEAGCRGRVMIGRSPMFVLQATLDTRSVDVNVHPNKLEVRFRQEQAVYEGLAELVRSALLRAQEPPRAEEAPAPAQLPQTEPAAPPAKQETPPLPRVPVLPRQQPAVLREGPSARMPSLAAVAQDARTPALSVRPFTPPVPEPAVETVETAEQVPLTAEEPKAPPRILGVAFDTYILVEHGEALYWIDQHAAHERILYDRFQVQLAQGSMSQSLLAPLVVSVTHREAALLSEARETLQSVGFEWSDFGDRTVRVTAVPVVLGQAQTDIARAFLDALEELKELPTEQRRRETLIQWACKKAVKGGDRLSQTEIEALLRQMEEGQSEPTCPHGRPICVSVSRRELEKRFKRIQ